MTVKNPVSANKSLRGNQLLQVFIAYAIFCGLSYLSQFAASLFGLVVLMGIGLPLVWGKVKGNWAEMGFVKHNTGTALLWGVLAGIITSLIGMAVVPQWTIPPALGFQLAIGIPLWAFIAVPFQEFFFRGWMQPRLENVFGMPWGLLSSTVLFTIWHYFAPFVGRTAVPLDTPIGALSTFGAGLVYAVAFQRTRNILTPWLAHVITGIAFIVIGTMDFTQPMM